MFTSMIISNNFPSPLFLLLLLLLLHLGCFTFSSHHHRRHRHDSLSSFSSLSSLLKTKLTTPPIKTTTTISSFIKHLFSSSSKSPTPQPPPTVPPSPSSSTRSLRVNPLPSTAAPLTHTHNASLHPCSTCGEIFETPNHLNHHQSTKHGVSDDLDSGGENIIRIIFQMGWPKHTKTNPIIKRILKIHHNPKTLIQFEEYREYVKSKASSSSIHIIRDERCVADGNELLRFYCTTFICDLESSMSICSHQYCSACMIIRNGFSSKMMDGISTMPTSWRAHSVIPEDLEEEFSFMHVKRALLVCRVIAGRVGCEPGLVDEEGEPGFDSLVGQGSVGFEDELLVFNPRAVLPCFVIAYTTM